MLVVKVFDIFHYDMLHNHTAASHCFKSQETERVLDYWSSNAKQLQMPSLLLDIVMDIFHIGLTQTLLALLQHAALVSLKV